MTTSSPGHGTLAGSLWTPTGQAALLFGTFLLAALLATLPLALNPSVYVPANADALLNAWVLKRVCEGLMSPLHALGGGMFYPDPASLLYSEPIVGIGLQALPLCAMPIDHVALYNASYWLLLATCALGAWFLAREITGSASAALVSAVVFAFTSANYDSAARLQIVASLWTPICLLFLIRFARRGRTRDAAFMGLAFALQALSCVYYELLLGLLLVLSVPWWVEMSGGLSEARRRIPGTLAAIGLVAVLVLPLNLAQQTHLSPVMGARTGGLKQVAPSYFSTVLRGNFLYGGWMDQSTGVPYDALYFPGLVPVVLAAIFVVWGLRQRDWCRGYVGLRPVLGIGLLAFALSFGSRIKTPWAVIPGPMAIFSSWVPGLAQVRVPSRFLMFARLALAVVAACVVHRMMSRAPRARARLVAVAIAAVCFLEHWSPSLEVWALPVRSELPEVYKWLEHSGAEVGAILEFPPAPMRLRRKEAMWLHMAAFHGHPLANGYSSFRPAWFEFAMETAIGPPGERWLAVLRTLGVRTVVVHPRSNGLEESDRAVSALLEYASRNPDTLRQVRSFSDSRRLDGMWSQLGDETVFSLSPVGKTAISLGTGATLDRTRWSCRSSEVSCQRAMDGDPATLLRGAEAQKAGDFIKVRFSERTKIQSVSIDLGRVPELFPRDPVIRVLQDDVWVAVNADLDLQRFLSDTLGHARNPIMSWSFPEAWASGFEIRLTSGGPGFRELGIPEIYAHAPR